MSTPTASFAATGAAAASALEADARLARQLQREEEEQRAARLAASAGSRAAAAASSPATAATASAAAACIASGLRDMSASDRAAALRALLNDDVGAGGGLGLTFDDDTLQRRKSSNNRDDRTGRDSSGLFLGLQPLQGEEVAFYPSRVSGQHNRAALGLSVILSGDTKRCMMFNYCWEYDWLLDTFPQLQTIPRVDFVRGSSERGGPRAAHAKPPTLLRNNIRLYEAPLPVAHGVHHSKMVISIYDHGCRVAVCTANFIQVDWIWKNNVSYVQDFPRKNACSPPSSSFETDLLDYLSTYRSCGLDVASELRAFDFSIARAILVPSVPGYHRGKDMHKYGHMKVRAVLAREVMPAKFANAPIVAQFSSIGATTEKWINDDLRTSLGMQARQRTQQTTNGASAAAPTAPAAASATGALMLSAAAAVSLPPLRVIWPHKQQVRQSLEGWSAGGSLCCDTKNMDRAHLLKLLHVWDGTGQGRDRAMPHIKSYCRPSADGELAWCLTTSANLSTAAWGALQKDASQLLIRHYELGTLFVPSHYARALARIKERRLENFTCTPDKPLILSPKGPLSMLPYFQERGPQSGVGGGGGSSNAPAAPATAVAPPRVRFTLLPPLGHLTWPTGGNAAQPAAATGAAGVNSAASASSGGGTSGPFSGAKRKIEATDLTGDDEEDGGGDGAAAATATLAPAAKKQRGDGGGLSPSPMPASVAASTVKLTASSAPAVSASSSSSSSSSVYTVVCPLPYAPLSRRYLPSELPWVWDKNCYEPDVHGNVHLPRPDDEDAGEYVD